MCDFVNKPPPIVSAFGDMVWGDGAVLIISKNLSLKGKFFEMVSWGGLGELCPPRNLRYPCLAHRGGSGGLRLPGISDTCALPPQRSCLAPVPCPQFTHTILRFLNLTIFGRTDLKISPSGTKFDEEADFDVHLAVGTPKPHQIDENLIFRSENFAKQNFSASKN